MRERYRERLETEKGFRQKESRRKAAYYAGNARYRRRVKAKVYAARAAKEAA